MRVGDADARRLEGGDDLVEALARRPADDRQGGHGGAAAEADAFRVHPDLVAEADAHGLHGLQRVSKGKRHCR
jgi:hypothetical protein